MASLVSYRKKVRKASQEGLEKNCNQPNSLRLSDPLFDWSSELSLQLSIPSLDSQSDKNGTEGEEFSFTSLNEKLFSKVMLKDGNLQVAGI